MGLGVRTGKNIISASIRSGVPLSTRSPTATASQQTNVSVKKKKGTNFWPERQHIHFCLSCAMPHLASMRSLRWPRVVVLYASSVKRCTVLLSVALVTDTAQTHGFSRSLALGRSPYHQPHTKREVTINEERSKGRAGAYGLALLTGGSFPFVVQPTVSARPRDPPASTRVGRGHFRGHSPGSAHSVPRDRQ